jgi:hypothetical protein
VIKDVALYIGNHPSLRCCGGVLRSGGVIIRAISVVRSGVAELLVMVAVGGPPGSGQQTCATHRKCWCLGLQLSPSWPQGSAV